MSRYEAARMGFMPEAADEAAAVLLAMGRPDDFSVAMDLARLVMISLPEAARTLCDPMRLRRLGLDPATVASYAAGQAESHTETFWGVRDVQMAKAALRDRP